MTDIEQLENLLAQSFHKHGDVPVTLGHLLNIVRVTRIRQQSDAEAHDRMHDTILDDVDPYAQEF